MAGKSQQYIDRFKQAAATDAVQTMTMGWLIIDGQAYERNYFVTDEKLTLVVAIPAMDWDCGGRGIVHTDEEVREIEFRVQGKMMEISHRRTEFAFTATFSYMFPDGFGSWVACMGFYDGVNRRGGLTVFPPRQS